MLMLHINRFAYDAKRNATVKLHQFIAFPSHLKLRPQWLSEDCPDRRGAVQGYRLVASIIHHGRNSQSERRAPGGGGVWGGGLWAVGSGGTRRRVPGCESACAPRSGAPASLANPEHRGGIRYLGAGPLGGAWVAPPAPDAADILFAAAALNPRPCPTPDLPRPLPPRIRTPQAATTRRTCCSPTAAGCTSTTRTCRP
jgi:hypothetical protein